MSTASQIFLLFYAVLYGVLFTISDRWRPFFISHSSKAGWYRLALAIVFFGVLPVLYFLWVFPYMLEIKESRTIHLAIAVYSVAPLVAFYFLWVWIVLRYTKILYSERERCVEPVKSSLEWVGEAAVSRVGVCVLLGALLVGPILALLILRSMSTPVPMAVGSDSVLERLDRIEDLLRKRC